MEDFDLFFKTGDFFFLLFNLGFNSPQADVLQVGKEKYVVQTILGRHSAVLIRQ